jgi:3',5'-cyclic AMP phosphodiesterase CpdA
MPIRVAVFSDLHCHPSTVIPKQSFLITDQPRLPASHHPIQSLLGAIKKEKLSADVVLLLGDLTNKSNLQGLLTGWSHIKEASTALGVSHDSILAVPGNHDIDSRDTDQFPDPFHDIKNFDPTYPLYGNDEFWSKGFSISAISGCEFLLLNSVFEHYSAEAAEAGGFALEQIANVELALGTRNPSIPLIAICHHHPIEHQNVSGNTTEIIKNGDRMMSALEKHNCTAFLHGHKHSPRFRLSVGDVGEAFPVFAAGSFSAQLGGGLGTVTRNLFHILELNTDLPAKGVLLNYEYRHGAGWTHACYDSSGFSYSMGFGEKAKDEHAQTVVRYIQSTGGTCTKWETVCEHEPDLKYFDASQLRQLNSLLETNGYNLYPPPPKVPEYVMEKDV